jgi:aryl-alcohol dehydrogenase-like predicted oxidoreductase
MHPEVHVVIVGIQTVEQLDGNERAAELEQNPEAMALLDEIVDINNRRPLQNGEALEAYS